MYVSGLILARIEICISYLISKKYIKIIDKIKIKCYNNNVIKIKKERNDFMRRLTNNNHNVEKNIVRVAKEPGIVSPIRAAVLKQFGKVTKETVKQYKAGV